jgi:hypothetical protein
MPSLSRKTPRTIFRLFNASNILLNNTEEALVVED